MYKVTVTDLSHLGGPMGTEYTTDIGTKIFRSRTNALTWITNDAKKKVRGGLGKPCSNYDGRISWDCGFIGYTLEALKVEDE